MVVARLPLRRPRDAQRRLLGGGEGAEVHLLATVPHLCLVGLGLAGLEVHAEEARILLLEKSSSSSDSIDVDRGAHVFRGG